MFRLGVNQECENFEVDLMMLYIYVVARDVLMNTAEPQINLGLLVRIWASLGLDSSTFSIGYSIFSLFIGKLWFFGQSKSGVEEMIQYAPGCHQFLQQLVDRLGDCQTCWAFQCEDF